MRTEVRMVRLLKQFRLSWVLVGLNILLILFFLRRLPPELPLYYSRPFGRLQLALAWQFWWLPTVSLLGVGINYFVALMTSPSYPVLVKLLSWFSLLVGLLSLAATINVLLLIF